VNPDVVAAIIRLRADRTLSADQATFCERVARRQLVSVWLEIRVLLYVGVLLLTSGVGLLIAEYHQKIGPWTLAGAIAVAAAACLVWVARTSPPFSWGEVPSPSVAFDYVLLLGLLLFASDLAYTEAYFTLLGPHWAHHLLVVGVGLGNAAVDEGQQLELVRVAADEGIRGVGLAEERDAPRDGLLDLDLVDLGVDLEPALVVLSLGEGGDKGDQKHERATHQSTPPATERDLTPGAEEEPDL
jgi:hypothetical protein